MTTPPYIKSGNRVALVATAKKIAQEEINAAIHVLEKWGLEVVLGQSLHNEAHQFAGTEVERAKDFQAALDDPTIQMILCARGGYGTVRMIDRLDFSAFCNNPKWIVGFSDITVLHSHIHAQFGIETLHGPMAINFGESKSLEVLKKACFGEQLKYSLQGHELNREGVAEGQVVGGNLSILYSLKGSASDINTDGKILFLEDLDEYLYHVDRMMLNLKRSGMLQGLAGLVVGGMTDMKDNEVPFGKTAEEIILETVSEYEYPVCFGFPAGHRPLNDPLLMGRKATLQVGRDHVELIFDHDGT